MRLKFNRPSLVASALLGLMSAQLRAETLPLILPEATFSTLPRITGNTLNQRLLDQHSTIRIQLNDPSEILKPDTPVVVFRQGLRLTTPGGQTLGVLAVPVARGQTLSQQAEAHEIANPNQPGVAWMRLQSLRQEVMRGDSIMSRTQSQAYQPPPCAPSNEANPFAESQVIALVSQADVLSSQGEVVVVSGGCRAGLAKGSTVTLWRPAVATYGRKLDQPIEDSRNTGSSVFADNPAITRNKTPGHRVGTATVVSLYPEAAFIQIKHITQAVQPGDLVRTSPAKAQP